ncbi:MAG: urease [Rhizobiales bacterium]|nr:urease [Hoeflea sp.]MBG19789.1 urease [Hyphomicrobiales bacterium]|tara:strand:+ start:121 stop:561 length:441 start_codon:yes stop_codon:yes gene_type:complete
MIRHLANAVLIPGMLALMAITASAQEQEPDVDCDNAVTQMEMTYCAGEDYAKADEVLNALWPEVVAKAKDFDADQGTIYADRGVPSSFEALRASQRAWIEYRDRQCEYEGYEYFGGTLQPMVGLQCETRLTEERSAWFRSILTQQN